MQQEQPCKLCGRPTRSATGYCGRRDSPKCKSAAAMEWIKRNSERAKELKQRAYRKFREQRPDDARKKARESYWRRRASVLEKAKARYRENPEKIRAYNKQWYAKKNKAKSRERTAARLAALPKCLVCGGPTQAADQICKKTAKCRTKKQQLKFAARPELRFKRAEYQRRRRASRPFVPPKDVEKEREKKRRWERKRKENKALHELEGLLVQLETKVKEIVNGQADDTERAGK